MPAISRDQVVAALAETLRDRLSAREPVEVPGLGTFAITHVPSRIEEVDGETVLTPPRDELTFMPSSSGSGS